MSRPVGSKNRKTRVLEILGAKSMRDAASRKALGQKLAREVLADYMMSVQAITVQCWHDMMADNLDIEQRTALRAEWRRMATLGANIAAQLAPYESPRLQSITVRREDPYAAMTDLELYAEMRRRADILGVKLPEKPKLVAGTVLNQASAKPTSTKTGD